jgi:hypothetical protein
MTQVITTSVKDLVAAANAEVTTRNCRTSPSAD